MPIVVKNKINHAFHTPFGEFTPYSTKSYHVGGVDLKKLVAFFSSKPDLFEIIEGEIKPAAPVEVTAAPVEEVPPTEETKTEETKPTEEEPAAAKRGRKPKGIPIVPASETVAETTPTA